ncbi:OmpA family protein [Nonomuraea sp. NPDC050556]|uniref:OmpA family protein n=1 Tax=Nonomuraea sp. NPDC050556 TaxID=3364369 RepID=UPI00379D6E94
MHNRILALTAVALTVAGCAQTPSPPPSAAPPSSPASSPSSAPKAPAVLATVQGTDKENYKAELVGLNRVGGKHLVVQLRLSTSTDEPLHWQAPLADPMRPLKWRWPSGIAVLDAPAHRWLMPYKPADGECLCSDTDRDGLDPIIQPGESLTVFAVLPAPSGNPATTTIVTPIGPPMVDVPISDEPPTPPPGQELPDPDASQVETVNHLIETPSQSLDRTEETTDDGADLKVSLSSDVLFALNKATLTPRARTMLARAAKLIDTSEDTTIQVDGHADSSGTNAINDPLSRRRAEAVRRALTPLVTREGVTFTARGYGSRRPLYSNDSDEGRRRNRRVTITFAKPAAAAPAATTSASPLSEGEGTSATVRAKGVPFDLQVKTFQRMPGDLGLLRYTITNRGDGEAWYHDLNWAADWNAFKYHAATNIQVTDPAARRLYRPARVIVAKGEEPGTYCACTSTSGVSLSATNFEAGETKEFWSLYALPPQADALTVKVATWPALRVPLN